MCWALFEEDRHMGGCAFLIRGMLAEHSLRPEPVERTLVDRIMGRQRFEKPTVIDAGGGRKVVDLPAHKYQVLREDFRTFLHTRIPDPWPATRAFLAYLESDVVSVYLRGEQGPDRTEPEYYIQMTFSGCAGTAETSAELGCHWAEIYYREDRERIQNAYLNHLGFVPDDSKIDSAPKVAFVPVGELGYARYVGDRSEWADAEWEGSRLFDLDASVVDSFYVRGTLSTLRELDERLGPLMADGACRCQLCMPDFQPLSIFVEA
jgi:hypothetical protein